MSNKVTKILKLIVDILTAMVFVVLITIVLFKVKMMVSGKDYFEIFGYSFFTVATGSMEPAISQNDIILVKRSKEYNVNDIITFRSENAYITHRIISKRGDTIVTKGDANNTKDVAIKESDVIGKVIYIMPKAGVWQKVFTSRKIIIMVFITLILFDFAFSYKGFQKKQNIKIVNKIPENIKLEQVNKVTDAPKMTKQQIETLKKKTETVKEGGHVKFDKEEKEFLNYTIRLDLNELQKQIDSKMKEKDD